MRPRQILWVFGALLGARPALGAPTAADRALAAELFERGRALLAEERYDEACPKLAESQRLDPGGGTLLNLALCHEKSGRTATAWAEYREALALASRENVEARVRFAEEHLAKLEPRLSRLTIIVPPESRLTELVVERDGSPVEPAGWGIATPIDPGEHRVEARAPGRVAFQARFTVKPNGDAQSIRIPVLDAAPAPPPPSPTPEPQPTAPPRFSVPAAVPASVEPPPVDSQHTAAYVAGGVGIAGILVGTVAGIWAFERDRRSDDACSNGCSERGLELNRQAGTAADVSTVAFSVGLVALGVGVTLWATSSPTSTTGSGRRFRPRRRDLHF